MIAELVAQAVLALPFAQRARSRRRIAEARAEWAANEEWLARLNAHWCSHCGDEFAHEPVRDPEQERFCPDPPEWCSQECADAAADRG